jgi:hypothetical protein
MLSEPFCFASQTLADEQFQTGSMTCIVFINNSSVNTFAKSEVKK